MKPSHLFAALAGAVLMLVILACCAPAHAEDIAKMYDPNMAAVVVLTDDTCAMKDDLLADTRIKKWYAYGRTDHPVTRGCWGLVGGMVIAYDADDREYDYDPRLFTFKNSAINKYLHAPSM